MKKDSKGSPVSKTNSKKPVTSSEISARLLKNIHESFVKEVMSGKIKVNPISKVLRIGGRERGGGQNPEQDLEAIQDSLSALRNSIIEQKVSNK